MLELNTSEKLEIVLNKLGVSQKELAKRLNTSQPNLSKKFKYNNWRESDLKAICKALNIKCNVIFKFSDGTEI